MNRLLLLVLLFVACNNPSTTTPDKPTDTTKQATTTTPAGETLLGVRIDADSQMLFITVVSNGCTAKNDFRFTLKNDVLFIERTRKDDCKRMPFATELSFSFAEAGINPAKAFTIGNAFAAKLLN